MSRSDHGGSHHDHGGSHHGASTAEEERLDQQIRFLLNDIQNKIEIAKTTIEDSIAFTNLKKTTQGCRPCTRGRGLF